MFVRVWRARTPRATRTISILSARDQCHKRAAVFPEVMAMFKGQKDFKLSYSSSVIGALSQRARERRQSTVSECYIGLITYVVLSRVSSGVWKVPNLRRLDYLRVRRGTGSRMAIMWRTDVLSVQPLEQPVLIESEV